MSTILFILSIVAVIESFLTMNLATTILQQIIASIGYICASIFFSSSIIVNAIDKLQKIQK